MLYHQSKRLALVLVLLMLGGVCSACGMLNKGPARANDPMSHIGRK